MNKTVSINLGGLFFHIDEDAYQKLNHYFDAIRRSLSADGRDEIMSDIEGRIAELLTEKLKSDNRVVSLREVEDIIAVMGQPEDYRIDDESGEKAGSSTNYSGYNPNYNYNYKTKKFYRDGDRSIVGGVCGGIAHYFRIDPLWIRIIFVLSLFITFSASLFVYILLWILIPKAITTTEKLEMTGEPINISNIEKKVKAEIDQFGERLKSMDYEKFGANVGSGAEKVGNGIAAVFMAIFKGIAKVIGAIITIFSALTLGGLVVFFITTLFTSALINTPWLTAHDIFNYTDTPFWVIGLLMLFTFGIPVFFLFLLGLKIMVENLKPIGNVTKYTLLALWILALSVSIYLGIRHATEIAYEGKVVKELKVNLPEDDFILKVKMNYNTLYSKSVDDRRDFRITQDSTDNDVIYSTNVEVHFIKTDKEKVFVEVEKLAEGSSPSEARKRAEKINYNFELKGNTLTLDNYLLTNLENKFRMQRVKVYVYLPSNSMLEVDKNMRDYIRSDYSDLSVEWSDKDQMYHLLEDKLECLTCVEDVVEPDAVYIESTTDPDSINIEADSQGSRENVKVKMKADENGLQIETETKRN
ncbi:PspC domain-containing protein [Flavobacterium sp. MFBS3-15]|uniref:PspC domain-containing protein n=1 Tax=Flavobacterium sp. MFBS3-15 TaxID=2989816 RepID=UPI0022368D7A|nr:PspC domain-containing protein [Flavobacterium sp. MFBS3-15]MCW4467521.1 PspC domain-containing protein [Flavobacterium sp. MFBS3-15]